MGAVISGDAVVLPIETLTGPTIRCKVRTRYERYRLFKRLQKMFKMVSVVLNHGDVVWECSIFPQGAVNDRTFYIDIHVNDIAPRFIDFDIDLVRADASNIYCPENCSERLYSKEFSTLKPFGTPHLYVQLMRAKNFLMNGWTMDNKHMYFFSWTLGVYDSDKNPSSSNDKTECSLCHEEIVQGCYIVKVPNVASMHYECCLLNALKTSRSKMK